MYTAIFPEEALSDAAQSFMDNQRNAVLPKLGISSEVLQLQDRILKHLWNRMPKVGRLYNIT